MLSTRDHMFGLSIFSKLLDWRLLLLMFIIAVSGYSVYYVSSKNSMIESLEQKVKIEKSANQILRNDVSVLTEAADQKDSVIKQMQEEKKIASETILKLSESVKQTNKTVTDIKNTLGEIKTAPTTEVGPYIRGALVGIKKLDEQK